MSRNGTVPVDEQITQCKNAHLFNLIPSDVEAKPSFVDYPTGMSVPGRDSKREGIRSSRNHPSVV